MISFHTTSRLVRSSLLTALLFASAAALGQPGNLSLQQIVDHMERAQLNSRANSVPYTVTRRYELGTPMAPNSEVVAQVDFVPPSQKDYSLRKVEGNSRGSEIVTKVLAHEAAMASQPQKSEITPNNYDFALLGQETIDGHSCYVLQLKPKRREDQLVRGRAWVDSSDFMVRRIQGQPAKSPSWWIKNLEITVDFAEVQGLWIQKATKAVADVRVIGPHVLTSREIDFHMTGVVNARNRQHSLPAQNGANAVADSAIWLSR